LWDWFFEDLSVPHFFIKCFLSTGHTTTELKEREMDNS
jgi:hypothetical protein